MEELGFYLSFDSISHDLIQISKLPKKRRECKLWNSQPPCNGKNKWNFKYCPDRKLHFGFQFFNDCHTWGLFCNFFADFMRNSKIENFRICSTQMIYWTGSSQHLGKHKKEIFLNGQTRTKIKISTKTKQLALKHYILTVNIL